jgi:hypothetical protein
MDMEHGHYTTSKPLTMAQLFDGRLGLHGIFEWDDWRYFGDTYDEAIAAGFDPCARCLTAHLCCEDECDDDDQGENIWVEAEDENGPIRFTCYLSKNNPARVFAAIEAAFDVKITCVAVETETVQ